MGPAGSAGSAGSAGGMVGFLALAGGAVAIGSAWLPWLTFGDQTKAGIDATTPDFGLANGDYLIAAGALAAVCGLLLVLGLARSKGARQLLGLGAIVGAIGVCVVEFSAFSKMNDAVTLANSVAGSGGSGVSVGWGIYVGAAAGAIGGLGGLLALVARPSSAGSGSPTVMPLVGAIAVVAIVAGVVFAAPQISKQLNGSKSSPVASATLDLSKFPTASPSDSQTAAPTDSPSDSPTQKPTSKPTKAPTAKPSKAPTPAGSFYTSGYSTPELAMNQFVDDQGYTYGGACTSPVAGADYCSSFLKSGASGSVYAIGSPGSAAEVWVLLRKISGKWYMVDVVTASAATTPPWH